jgi:Flp pilus assembly protein CpaB
VSARLHDLTRTARRHRAPLAGLLAAGAVVTALPLVAPAPAATTQVLVAARDLAPGTPLTDTDVRTVAVPAALLPEGVLIDSADVLGRSVGGPVRRGEALTDVRLLGSGLLQRPGLVAVPVRLADAATAALLRAGDRVDVLATPTGGDARSTRATVVAGGVQVLAVPTGQEGDDGALVVVAATTEAAARLAAAAVTSRLSVTVQAS